MAGPPPTDGICPHRAFHTLPYASIRLHPPPLASTLIPSSSLARTPPLLSFTTGYTYLVQILPVLVVSPLYFAGSVELGVITQSTGAFNHVLNDLSIIVNQFEGISSFSAGLNRLGSFVERMETYQT